MDECCHKYRIACLERRDLSRARKAGKTVSDAEWTAVCIIQRRAGEECEHWDYDTDWQYEEDMSHGQ
jgi:hypothetical protein